MAKSNKKKFYAVRVGKNPGIYTTWDDCKKQIFKFPGCVYASFETLQEAEAFMAPEIINFEDVDLDEIDAYAFVDGSFNPYTEVYGYGGFLIYRYMEDNERKENKLIIKGCGEEYDLVPMRNIAGELLGSRKAMELAITKSIPEIYIFYDYAGIENWANGCWQRTREGTMDYFRFYQREVKDHLKVHFVKVKGHKGIPGNEEADLLAKIACGVVDDSDYNKELSDETIENFVVHELTQPEYTTVPELINMNEKDDV